MSFNLSHFYLEGPEFAAPGAFEKLPKSRSFLIWLSSGIVS
jgi:hypothetical protein